MEKFLFSAVVFAIISSGLAQQFCNYEEEDGIYQCNLSLGNVPLENANNPVGGVHMPSKTDNDVQKIYSVTIVSVHLLTSAFTTFKNLEIMEFTKSVVASMNNTNFFDCDKLKRFTLIGATRMEIINSRTFAACKNLDEINLSDNSIASLQNEAFFELGLLTILDLSNNDITSLSQQVFQPLVELKTLNLNKNAMTSLPNTLFAGTTKLQVLSISENQIDGLNKILVEKLTSLTTLNLTANRLNKAERGFFDTLTSLTQASFANNICISRDFTSVDIGSIKDEFETCFKNNGAAEIIIYSKVVLLIIAIGTKFL